MTDRVDCMAGLLVLFGRRIKPIVLVELYEDPPKSPTAPQESSTNALPVASREYPTGVPSAVTQEDLINTPPIPIAPHEDQADVPHATPQDGPASIQPTASSQRILPMPGAYDVDW